MAKTPNLTEAEQRLQDLEDIAVLFEGEVIRCKGCKHLYREGYCCNVCGHDNSWDPGVPDSYDEWCSGCRTCIDAKALIAAKAERVARASAAKARAALQKRGPQG